MSTVIKAGQAGPILKNLSTVDLADHLAEADVVVERATRNAAKIVSETRRDAELTLKEAKDRGYRDGHAKGYEEGISAGHEAAYRESMERFSKQQAGIVSAMRQAVDQISEIKDGLRIAAERDLLEFAVQVASKLTFAVGRVHREAATENLSRALRLVGSKTNLTVRGHPDEIASTRTFAESVLDGIDATAHVNVVADDTLQPGGCKVSTDRSDIDATLETQVEEMTTWWMLILKK